MMHRLLRLLDDMVATAAVRLFNLELPASFVASWKCSTDRSPDHRANEVGQAPWVGQHWTWTPEAVSPHGLPLEVMTTLSEPGWPRCPNDLMTKTIKAVEQPLRNRIYAFGEQRSEALQQGVTLVSA